MRLCVLLIFSCFLVACSAYERQVTVTQESRIAKMQSSYAMSTPAGQPSSACAKNVNDVITHLEMLMAKKAAAKE